MLIVHCFLISIFGMLTHSLNNLFQEYLNIGRYDKIRGNLQEIYLKKLNTNHVGTLYRNYCKII